MIKSFTLLSFKFFTLNINLKDYLSRMYPKQIFYIFIIFILDLKTLISNIKTLSYW